MIKKKKILILCVDFPPWPSVGAQRPASWCLYADPNEFDITVITRKWKNTMTEEADYFVNPSSFPDEAKFGHAKVYYTEFKPNLRDKIILAKKSNIAIKIIQKILTGFYYLAQYYIRIFDNTREIYYKAREYLKNNPDTFMIIATGEPFITFRYAFLLSKKYGIPWCADYRDGWSTNYSIPYMPLLQQIALKLFFKGLEKNMIKSASIVVTVTPSLKETLQSYLNRDIRVIFNGFNSQEITEATKTQMQLAEKFTITYLGSLYPFQPLEEFALFLSNLIKENILEISRLTICFIGGINYTERINNAFELIPNLDLQITDKLDRIKALKLAYSSHLLLLLSSSSIDGSAAKIYEYLALRRPIFVFKNDNGTIKFLTNYTKSGFLYDNYETAKEYLEDLFNAYLGGKSEKFRTNPINIEEFSREYQTKKFFELIKSHGRG